MNWRRTTRRPRRSSAPVGEEEPVPAAGQRGVVNDALDDPGGVDPLDRDREVNMREHTPWPAESGPELDLSGRFRGILERYSLSEGFSYGAWGTNEPAA